MMDYNAAVQYIKDKTGAYAVRLETHDFFWIDRLVWVANFRHPMTGRKASAIVHTSQEFADNCENYIDFICDRMNWTIRYFFQRETKRARKLEKRGIKIVQGRSGVFTL